MKTGHRPGRPGWGVRPCTAARACRGLLTRGRLIHVCRGPAVVSGGRSRGRSPRGVAVNTARCTGWRRYQQRTAHVTRRFRLAEDLADELPVSTVGIHRRARLDLRAVGRDHAHRHRPRLAAAPAPARSARRAHASWRRRNSAIVESAGVSWGADRPVGDILVAGARNCARGAVPARVRVPKHPTIKSGHTSADQPRPTDTRPRTPPDPPHRHHPDRPDQMLSRQPLHQRRRPQQRLTTVTTNPEVP